MKTQKFIEKLEVKFKKFMNSKKEYKTPILSSVDYSADSEKKLTVEKESFPYREIVGLLFYLRASRMDILFALHLMSTFSHKKTFGLCGTNEKNLKNVS